VTAQAWSQTAQFAPQLSHVPSQQIDFTEIAGRGVPRETPSQSQQPGEQSRSRQQSQNGQPVTQLGTVTVFEKFSAKVSKAIRIM